jgi:hypothetical protein
MSAELISSTLKRGTAMQGSEPPPLEQESPPQIQLPTVVPSGRSRRGIAAIATGIAIVVVAGGVGLGLALSHHIGSSPSTTGSGVATNNPSVTGCPGSASDVHWPQPAAVTLTTADANSTTTVSGGAVVAIELASGYRWMYVEDASGNIAPQSPAGAYRSDLHACEWRFAMPTTSGAYNLVFERRCLYVPGKVCSDIAVFFPFHIVVR